MNKRLLISLLFESMFEHSQQTGYFGNPPNKQDPMLETDGGQRLSEESKNIKKGLKPFYFKNGMVWALNQKTADKKALKQGLL